MTFQEFIDKYQKVPVEEYQNNVLEMVPNPMVSCRVSTYQHAPYIRQCLDGILMQKTNFLFEIVIGEDESSDGTREICIEYAKKYPDIIRLFLHKRENNILIGGKPSAKFQGRYTMYKLRGKYQAICEGDDYWIDPYKLQKQVDFLENNPDCILCGTRTFVQRESSATPYAIEPGVSPEALMKINGKSFLLGQVYLKTLSRMYPKRVVDEYYQQMTDLILVPEDYLITLYLISKAGTKAGIICCLDEVMTCYREHLGGTWFGISHEEKLKTDLDVLVFALNTFNFGSLRKRVEGYLLSTCIVLNITSCGVKSVDFKLMLNRFIPKKLFRFAKKIYRKVLN